MDLKKIALIFIFTFAYIATSYGQEVDNSTQSRLSVGVSTKIADKLKFEITPEVRLDDNFSIDKYLLENSLVYKPAAWLKFAATYWVIYNNRANKDNEFEHKYAFSAAAKKEFNRLEAGFRLRYSDYSDDSGDGEFLRYKLSGNYNIAKSKLEPNLSFEAFQSLSDGGLYKMRYGAGLDYKLSKKSRIGFGYKLDYYIVESKNRHIMALNYDIKI